MTVSYYITARGSGYCCLGRLGLAQEGANRRSEQALYAEIDYGTVGGGVGATSTFAWAVGGVDWFSIS